MLYDYVVNMGRRATALKSCPGCGGQIPTACKSCACGYQFRKLSTGSPTESPTDPMKRRRTERTRREKPHYFNHLDFEHQFKRRRNRTLSGSVETSPVKKKVNRSTNVLNRHTADSQTSKGSRLNLCKSKAEKNKDSNSSSSSSTSSEDMFACISQEKALQFAIILADINRKYVGQNFRPV